MSDPCLPPELQDHIVDLLHDTRDTLKSCCLVSKSWIPCARKHLFAHIVFRAVEDLESWKNTFQDPSTSPACYAKSLAIKFSPVITTADVEEGGWISTFSQVKDFQLNLVLQPTNEPMISLIPFHGFSSVLTSLFVEFSTHPLSRVSKLIHSFPSLENLYLLNHDLFYGDDGSDDQLDTSPPPSSTFFTGFLNLSLRPGMSPIIPRLLSSSCSHFRGLHLSWFCEQDVLFSAELVERCASSLEFLQIDCFVGKFIQYQHPS